jgi:non-homologous end joining protein Ku
MDKVAIGRVVLTSREHIIALEPLDKGLVGTLLRYPYEVRGEEEYFDEIQDVKVTKDMLDLARHIVNQKSVLLSHGTKFKSLDGSTQNWQRRTLEDICVAYGHL